MTITEQVSALTEEQSTMVLQYLLGILEAEAEDGDFTCQTILQEGLPEIVDKVQNPNWVENVKKL